MTQTPNTAHAHGMPPAGATPASTPSPADANGATPSEQSSALTWETWLAKLPEEQRTLAADLHTKQVEKLQTTLDKERSERKAFEKQLRDMAKNAEAGSEAQKQLTGMADRLAEAERRADFYRDAAKPDVGIADPEAAWIIANAKADEFFDARGNLKIALLRERHPSLFAQPKPPPKANAGNGARTPPVAGDTMNDFIRAAAGKR